MTSELLNSLRQNDTRVLSGLISAVENGDDTISETLNSLFPHSRDSLRIGITGPPGAGKSTLIDKLIVQIRAEDGTVGVVSVDPTSFFSGGALLGDRVRMNRHSLDPAVYVRSMGSRGHTGGLARLTHQVADVIASTGKDYIIVETVGVGQAETEIVLNVDIVVVVFVPESGDEIQIMKAGPMEVGDIFVINKADRAGADRISQLLQDYMSDSSGQREFVPQIILTEATEGKGIEQLWAQCRTLMAELQQSGTIRKRRNEQYLSRVRNAVHDELAARFWNSDRESVLMKQIDGMRERHLSPYEAADQLVNELG